MAKDKGVTFIVGDREYHSYKTFGLILGEVEITAPEIQEQYEDIPGIDGQLDLSEALTGDVLYKNRTIKMTLYSIGDMHDWFNMTSSIQNILHGRNCKIIFDVDSAYYWQGRVKVDIAHSKRTHTITIECNAEPYKYEISNRYKDIKIDGNCCINIIGGRKREIPSFTTTCDNLQIDYNNKTYFVSKNEEKAFSDIIIEEGNNILSFTGTGTFSIKYKGGIL